MSIAKQTVGICMLLCMLMAAGSAAAATRIDLNPDNPIAPVIPTVVAPGASPVYVTNGTGSGASASAHVDSLRVGAGSSLHLGYDGSGSAGGDIGLGVAGNMIVEGKAAVGGSGVSAHAVGVAVGNDLVVQNGGALTLNGAGDDKQAVVAAEHVYVVGGEVRLENDAVLRTNSAAIPNQHGYRRHALKIGDGGRLVLDGGLPVAAGGNADREYDRSGWTFKGAAVAAGGDGVLIGQGGTLAAGDAGGAAAGAAAQRLETARGGLIDASRGSLVGLGFGDAALGGAYRAGYGGGQINYLSVEDGRVTVKEGANLSLSRELARHLNTSGAGVLADAVILRGREIRLEDGAPTTLKTGMGTYRLAHETSNPAQGGGTWDYLRVGGVENAVLGSGTESDRETFRRNMEGAWDKGMNAAQAANIYNLAAVEQASVVADGESGRLNQAVLEALVDGRNQQAGSGYADAGLYEMYNAAAQWGVNAAAYNASAQFMAGLNRRVERIGAEMDRLGETGTSGSALASCAEPDFADNRVWMGGFGYNESADLDYGVSGYTYRPRGFMTGYDRTFDAISLGGAVAYAKGDYRDKAASGGDSDITSYSAGVYGAYHGQSGFNASAFATYTHLDNDISDIRGGMRRDADYTSYSWSLGARAGYDMYLTDRLMLSPSGGLTKIRAVGRSHDERLNDVAVLRVGKVRRDSTLVPLDLTVGYDLHKDADYVLRLTGNLGYAYDLESGGLTGGYSYVDLVGATEMGVADRAAGRHSLTVGAGVVYTSSWLDVGARYDYFHRSEQRTHQVKGDVGVKF